MAEEPPKVRLLLNWNRFSEHVTTCMAKLMTDSTYSDVIIASGDKRLVYAHKFVLGNSSKYFHRLLKQMARQRGSQPLIVALPEVNYEIIKILMNYMYRGETQVAHDLLPTVVKVGRLLEINGLTDLHEDDCTETGIIGASIWPPQLPAPESTRPALPQPNERRETRTVAKAKTRESSCSAEARRRQNAENVAIDSTSELPGSSRSGRSGGNRRYRPILPKNETATRGNKKDSIHLPLKRKYTRKDQDKECSSSTESQTIRRTTTIQQETHILKVKREKLEEECWDFDCPSSEDVSVKADAPVETYDIININYNELNCAFCNVNFSTPTERVRPMSDQHAEYGLETNIERENEEGSDSVFNCVICSESMHSASEWIQHIRIWHTDSEFTPLSRPPPRRPDTDPELNDN